MGCDNECGEDSVEIGCAKGCYVEFYESDVERMTPLETALEDVLLDGTTRQILEMRDLCDGFPVGYEYHERYGSLEIRIRRRRTKMCKVHKEPNCVGVLGAKCDFNYARPRSGGGTAQGMRDQADKG